MNPRISTGRRETLWHKAHRLSKTRINRGLRSWLMDNGSLTRRLRAACAQPFRVKIINQGWATPLANEAQNLGVPRHQRVFCREVLLYCGTRPMVFARTAIPRRTLKGKLNRLANLGEKPLGEILFNDPHIQRYGLEIAHLAPGELLFDKAQRAVPEPGQIAGAIWARRSTFMYHERPLLVCEIFLPNPEFTSRDNIEHETSSMNPDMGRVAPSPGAND